MSSDARAVALRLEDPHAVLVDAAGRTYERSTELEKWLDVEPLDKSVEAGDSYRTSILFDVPANATGLKLLLTNGHAEERLAELFLIGDEDSFLHRKAYQAIGT